MKSIIFKGLAALGMTALAYGFVGAANAQSLEERAESGQPIRIGFANEIPFAYPGDDGSPHTPAGADASGLQRPQHQVESARAWRLSRDIPAG